MVESSSVLEYGRPRALEWREIVSIGGMYWAGSAVGLLVPIPVAILWQGFLEAIPSFLVLAVITTALLSSGGLVMGAGVWAVGRMWARVPGRRARAHAFAWALVPGVVTAILGYLPATSDWVENSDWLWWVVLGVACGIFPLVVVPLVTRAGEVTERSVV